MTTLPERRVITRLEPTSRASTIKLVKTIFFADGAEEIFGGDSKSFTSSIKFNKVCCIWGVKYENETTSLCICPSR